MYEKSSVICLSKSQVKTNILNMAKLMKLPKPEIVFSGKLKVKQDDIDKYNLNTVKERADCYELWESKDKFYFLVIYSNKFEAQYFVACDWFNHIFKDFVRKEVDRPKVYLCYAFVLSKKQYKTIPMNLLNCPYRLIEIADVHPITGSPNGCDTIIMDYELLETKEKAFNGKEYSDILTSDPIVKVLNALPGELIRAKMIFSDKGNVFTTYKIRRVKLDKTKVGMFDKSGVDNFKM